MRVLIKLKSPFVIYAQVAIWLFSPYPIHPTPEKSPQKAIFLAQFKKKHYLCTVNLRRGVSDITGGG